MIRESAEKGGLNWMLECLLFAAVLIASAVAEAIPSVVLILVNFLSRKEDPIDADAGLLVSLFSTAIAVVVVLLFCRFAQKRPPASVGFRKKNAGREYLVGMLVGTVMISAAIGLCAATGSVRIGRADEFRVGLWVAYLIGFLIQGASEEILFRGYFMVSFARKNSLVAAVIISSVFFAAAHLLNEGVNALALANLFLFGVLAALWILRRGSLWGACAMHSLWNFVQGNVFGVSVSGTETVASPLETVADAGRTFWNGGEFGAEGGFSVTIVLAIGVLLLLFVIPDRSDERAGSVSLG